MKVTIWEMTRSYSYTKSLSATWEIIRYMGVRWCSCSWISVRGWKMTHSHTKSPSDTITWCSCSCIRVREWEMTHSHTKSLSNTWEILRYVKLAWCMCSWIRVREVKISHSHTKSLSDPPKNGLIALWSATNRWYVFTWLTHEPLICSYMTH